MEGVGSSNERSNGYEKASESDRARSCRIWPDIGVGGEDLAEVVVEPSGGPRRGPVAGRGNTKHQRSAEKSAVQPH